MPAGGVAVEGDIHVVDPGAGHHDSFCDRTQRLTYRPAVWPGSSPVLTSCPVAGPHPYHTRPGMVSQGNDGGPHGKPPRHPIMHAGISKVVSPGV
jgi:hypothetical protein